MKAAAWAERFQTSSAETISEEFRAFIGEIGDVAQKRGDTIHAIEGAVRDQERKYQAVCRLYPSLGHFPFATILQEFGGEYAEKAEAARQHNAKFREERLNPKPRKRGRRAVASK